MGEHVLPGRASRPVLASVKYDAPAEGVGSGVYRLRRLGRPGVGVYPHLAEVVTETRLHDSAVGLIQRSARRAEHLANDGRHSLRLGGESWTFCGMTSEALVAALGTLAGRSDRAPARALALQ